MNRWLAFLLGAVGLWIATGVGATIALRSGGSVFAPSLPVLVIGTLGLYLSRSGGLVLGFVGGFLEAAAAGANPLPYIVTRMLAGVLAASLGAQTPERGVPVAALSAAGATLAANGLLVFLLAPRGFGFFLLAAVVGAVVNGVLALPLGAVWARLSARRERAGF